MIRKSKWMIPSAMVIMFVALGLGYTNCGDANLGVDSLTDLRNDQSQAHQGLYKVELRDGTIISMKMPEPKVRYQVELRDGTSMTILAPRIH